MIIENLQPRMLELLHPEISRPSEAGYYSYRVNRAAVAGMMAEINKTYGEIQERKQELARLQTEELSQLHRVAKANTEMIVLQRMRTRLGTLLDQELELQMNDQREELTKIMYDSYFRIRFLNDFEAYMSALHGTGATVSKSNRSSTLNIRRDIFELPSKERSRELQRRHFEKVCEDCSSKAHVAIGAGARDTPDSRIVDAYVFDYMQEQIEKEIFDVRKMMLDEKAERHAFNLEGWPMIAGLLIKYHWDIVVSRACKRDMLRRILSTENGDTIRWYFIEDLEALLETSVTSNVPKQISCREMHDEFVALFHKKRARRQFYSADVRSRVVRHGRYRPRTDRVSTRNESFGARPLSMRGHKFGDSSRRR